MNYWVNVPVGETVNLREGPSKDTAVVARLPRGTEVECIGTFSPWKHVIVTTDTSLKGFIRDDFLSSSPIALSTGALWIPRYGTTIWKMSRHQKQYHAEVKNIQSDLKTLGFSVGKVDGYYGSNTVNGVKQFQRQSGLDADGAFGDLSKTALWNQFNH